MASLTSKPLGSGECEFFFAKRSVHVSNCDVYAPRERPGAPDAGLVGYFLYDYAPCTRCRLLRAPRNPDGGANFVGLRIEKKKLSQVTPEHWCRDPYLVCLLLSLAQRQARSQALPRPSAYTVRLLRFFFLDHSEADCSQCRLLVTTWQKQDRDHIFLYEAAISPELVDPLATPHSTHRATWPTINMKKNRI